jgi:hypothetical protein
LPPQNVDPDPAGVLSASRPSVVINTPTSTG